MAVEIATGLKNCDVEADLKPLEVVSDQLISVSRVMKVLGGLCLMGMVLVTTADIIGRYFGSPVFGSEEITAMLASLSVAFAMPYAHRKDVHVGVEMVVNRMPKRLSDCISGWVRFFSFLIFSLISWRMFAYGNSMRYSGELSMNLALPEYFVVYVLAFCFAVFAVQLLVDFLKYMSRG